MAKKTGKRLPAAMAETAMEREVLAWLNEKGEDYQDGWRGVAKDLAHGGGSSGMISHLIYTADCSAFYEQHRAEIDKRLYETLDDCGSTPAKLFERAGWDATDPLAREDGNKGILAWFGWEETARDLARRGGLEL